MTCRDMVHGLLAGPGDHNCRTMARAAGHPAPHRMQHLLSRGRVDEQQMPDAVADWAAGCLRAGQDEDDVVLIADGTAGGKSSGSCAGAACQYSGTAGGTALCQVAVTLTIAAPDGHALTGRALYLPGARAADEERRELAGVPDDVMFATKPQLAGRLLQHAHDQGTRAAFVVGDEACGGLDLRKGIRERGTGYVLAVRSGYSVTLPSGRVTVKTAARLVKPAMWQRMRTGPAAKGARDCHRAMTGITPGGTPGGHDDGHAFPLLRKHRYTGTVSYFLCWSPGPVPLATLIPAAVTRWRTGEDHQLTKQAAGLDSGQVTTWASWHRQTAISLPACAFPAVALSRSHTIRDPALLLSDVHATMCYAIAQLYSGMRTNSTCGDELAALREMSAVSTLIIQSMYDNYATRFSTKLLHMPDLILSTYRDPVRSRHLGSGFYASSIRGLYAFFRTTIPDSLDSMLPDMRRLRQRVDELCDLFEDTATGLISYPVALLLADSKYRSRATRLITAMWERSKVIIGAHVRDAGKASLALRADTGLQRAHAALLEMLEQSGVLSRCYAEASDLWLNIRDDASLALPEPVADIIRVVVDLKRALLERVAHSHWDDRIEHTFFDILADARGKA